MSSSEEEEKITRTKKPLSEARLKAIEKMKEGRRKQLEQQKKDKLEKKETIKKIKKEKKKNLIEETSLLNNLSNEQLNELRKMAISAPQSNNGMSENVAMDVDEGESITIAEKKVNKKTKEKNPNLVYSSDEEEEVVVNTHHKKNRRKQKKPKKRVIINNYYDDDDDSSEEEEEEVNNYYSKKQMARRPNKKNHKEESSEEDDIDYGIEGGITFNQPLPRGPMSNISFC